MGSDTANEIIPLNTGVENRKLQGPKQDKLYCWRIRTNDQLQLCTTTIKVCELGSAGHVVRIPENKTVKNVFLGNPNGSEEQENTFKL
jgi:hypothetical protein